MGTPASVGPDEDAPAPVPSQVEVIAQLRDRVENLTAKVDFLLSLYVKDAADGTFTFPDGESWPVLPNG